MILGELCNFAGTLGSVSFMTCLKLKPLGTAAYAFVEAIVVVRSLAYLVQRHSDHLDPTRRR